MIFRIRVSVILKSRQNVALDEHNDIDKCGKILTTEMNYAHSLNIITSEGDMT